ncbi:hypothetical protein DICPUDRAFT_148513 [Dictyostelium purpureum]|uniref:Carbohydrate binding domain-containing protein n=1 Tax=Dictyostelium purpureum TaxID=5786 RepID=F0ZBB1_DICPU|nr:uncharacterized protein DICPUDRAFT_148513 [Dictyostelium purpureum]EGC38714.1 hypothetical protein DICPUDRAFT_148513 [Dictyostelium purpureum]|eukprot:XP_003284705.1 hypothetical protein DICPUDRAFT_148513 [Dictyostelium purpureum]
MKIILFIFLIIIINIYNNILVRGEIDFKVPCGDGYCGYDQVCYKYNPQEDVSVCLLADQFNLLELVQTFEKTWIDHYGDEYSLFRVKIQNHSNKPITHLYLATDFTFDLKEKSSYWNIHLDTWNNFLTLPNYVNSIQPFSYHLFGYIVKGKTSPNMIIRSITYSDPEIFANQQY